MEHDIEVFHSFCLWAVLIGSILALFLKSTLEKRGFIELKESSVVGSTLTNDDSNTFLTGIVQPEDTEDGIPVDEDAFWSMVSRKKVFMIIIQTMICSLEATTVIWSLKNHGRVDLGRVLPHAIFPLYLLGLQCAWLIPHKSRRNHATLHSHITVLALTTTVLDFVSFILRRRPVAINETHGVQWIIAMMYVVLTGVSFLMPRGPGLYYPHEQVYPLDQNSRDSSVADEKVNVCQSESCSFWGTLVFSYTHSVLQLGKLMRNIDISELPVLPASMRAPQNFVRAQRLTPPDVSVNITSHLSSVACSPSYALGRRIVSLNAASFMLQFTLAVLTAVTTYGPAWFLQMFVKYLETPFADRDMQKGWVLVVGLTIASVTTVLISQQLWKVSMNDLEIRIRLQLNSMLYAKTLVRKDTTSASTTDSSEEHQVPKGATGDEFSSKTQVMNLMTADVDRVCDFSWHIFTLVDSPIEIFVGLGILYNLLGMSSAIGLSTLLFIIPINQLTGRTLISTQENLMKTRDERVGVMNEILGGIRMIKFMAWERNFSRRVLDIREKELKYQKRAFIVEVLWTVLWSASPILVILVTFYHFTVIQKQQLTPSIAFPSIIVFSTLKFALNSLPETFAKLMQSLVSLRRIATYLQSSERDVVPAYLSVHASATTSIAFENCTVTWPKLAPSTSPLFSLSKINVAFPAGKLTLVCGKVGSGKTLLLLALLGEAEVLDGNIRCPRTPADFQASVCSRPVRDEDWIVEGVCAYVPQIAWLRNASIRDNILFNLPYKHSRYQKTLAACALINDLKILEDGDLSEIGESGVNLSGGQKARVSLARAVYSRASNLFLDDVLSAVDAHTADHIYQECFKGELMKGRTVILVSHHVHLCAPQADYVVALENGAVGFQGTPESFLTSDFGNSLVMSAPSNLSDTDTDHESILSFEPKTDIVASTLSTSETCNSTTICTEEQVQKGSPRRFVEEELRAVGSVKNHVWYTYFCACGSLWYWSLFSFIMVAAAISPVFENSWLRRWASGQSLDQGHDPIYYITVYAAIATTGIVMGGLRWFALYYGSLKASRILYSQLLEAVLFAKIRFHDTVSRGRLLNRFGRDFEVVDSHLSNDLGQALTLSMATVTSLITIVAVVGWPFLLAMVVLGVVYLKASKLYGQACRELRRLESTSRSPLYSLYGETISGVTVIRAFGASSVSMRNMLRCLDMNTTPFYWIWNANRWVSTRFSLISSTIVSISALICLVTPSVSASLAGFILTFASTISEDILYAVRFFVQLEQSMIAVERIDEYVKVESEAPEFTDAIIPKNWPSKGEVKCQDLSVRYAPHLKDALSQISFTINAGEKIGVLGRTGSGKSTLALSLFRFIEVSAGHIFIDDLDISKIGLTDLRSALNIIPQDSTILSGTLRSTLDIFGLHTDAEIYDALRRVHLIPSSSNVLESGHNPSNKFTNLDANVSESGDNFSMGCVLPPLPVMYPVTLKPPFNREKQLICMARALLKRAKILVMDEATASVDYATDEHIAKVISEEFAETTIITIAHRIRTVIDYDRVMVLDEGRVIEYDSPASLLQNSRSIFYHLCKSTGPEEFEVLKLLAGVKRTEKREQTPIETL
ncbi:ABC transporter 7 [Psilocybe cubensis]|uniref:Uncharacterized protein n=2 Tax=Psilocybe cubensis TaxID=181762 RepID=A0A8H7XQL3_PSICU|nr:ABC transporter 7 [Psilocybe cubensis]KAH9475078.1 ABC transporter 7 [Psilocybe cubensis]